MINITDTFEKCQRHAKVQAEANRMNKATVFDLLAQAEIASVTAEFDGEGDSGQINDIIAYKDREAVPLPDSSVTLLRASWDTGKQEPQQATLYDAIETLCYDYLSQQHGGWEDNDGGFGEFTFEVAERKVELEFNARFSDSTLFTHSF
jgi:hypothetical protein